MAEGYRHKTPVTVRFADIDSMGHVNNANYMTYIELGRIAYLNDVHVWDGKASAAGIIVAKVTIEFKKPIVLEDQQVHVWTRTSRLGNKSFDVEHLITRSADGEITAIGSSVLVAFDYSTQQAIPLPTAWRESLTDYEPML